ncbi:hypothetical protein PU629_12735 [Pullulanibacillus sp. KACC 23026]|uniref:hypothetical protein n=1 Tax=Pullulanibacillus sp. KACC 23026 TaxID=3028315 RepID=UPI0023B1742A|nr:hypothetical protein [Pullulanibacillus sp. KACC 23026]WEG11042.1 hypothetical protein PU629_12735 [Pullulanibacillus sp. KACC 23026]
MRIKLGVGASLLCALILGLSGCSSDQASKSTKEQTPSTSQSTGTTNASTTKENKSANNGSVSSQKSEPSSESSQTQNSGQSTEANTDNGSSSTKGSTANSGNGSSNGQTNTAPTTIKRALNDVSKSIQTKVPVMLPTDVPVAKGHYLTAATHSETWYYKAQLFETNKPASINSKEASAGTAIATVEGTEYKSSAEAQKQITGYTEVQATEGQMVDLGNGIQALSEGAAGHAFLYWNEGRWCIRVDSPTDPAYQNKAYPDSKKLAENVVAYLHDNALPAPQMIGVVTITNWNQSTLTTVQWQYHQMVYQVSSRNPLTALQIAVAMK